MNPLDEKIKYHRVNYKIMGIVLIVACFVIVVPFSLWYYMEVIQAKPQWAYRFIVNIACFIAVLGYGIYYLLKEKNIRAKIAYLEKFGQPQLARVMSCLRYRNKSGGVKTSWLKVKLLHIPMDSDLLSDDYRGDLSALENQFVTVFVDPANPRYYYVDVNSYRLNEDRD